MKEMDRPLRIGTRDSQLAVWQAVQVKENLEEKGATCELVYIKSEGDLDLVTPLYQMGVQGVFTRALDMALLNQQIDIAVHSMKDVPTIPAEGLCIPAVLPRGNYKDVIVAKDREEWFSKIGIVSDMTIATSSVRRKAQWLNRYPQHTMENLRGNINTRLKKVAESQWDGAVFAAAGLERLNLQQAITEELDWMLPAPAQGVICLSCRENDEKVKEICTTINDPLTLLCATIERHFLQTLMGGCSTPIAALAILKEGQIHFEGKVFALDGSDYRGIACTASMGEAVKLGQHAAEQLLYEGADRLIAASRNG